MIELPLLQSCNKCGECCRHGGSCTLRGEVKSSWKFEGSCEHLVFQPDGRVLCGVMIGLQRRPNNIWPGLIRGVCNFPEYRKDV